MKDYSVLVYISVYMGISLCVCYFSLYFSSKFHCRSFCCIMTRYTHSKLPGVTLFEVRSMTERVCVYLCVCGWVCVCVCVEGKGGLGDGCVFWYSKLSLLSS